jgi:Ca-activated chloride channel family protein
MSPNAKPAISLPLSMVVTAGVLSLAVVTQLHKGQATAAVAVDTPVEVAPIATDGIQVSGSVDRTAIHTSDRQVRMELVVSSDDVPSQAPRAPTDLIVVLDRSGSMTGEKLLDAKSAARELVSLLGEEDRFSLITYSGQATLNVELDYATDNRRDHWNHAINSVQAAGGTKMQAGLSAALSRFERAPGRVMRTILISDGLPDRPDGLIELASQSATREIPLTTVGIGLDYDERLMTALADAGTGSFYWTKRGDDLASAFAREFDQARETVASQVAVSFYSDGGTTLKDTAGYLVTKSSFDIGSVVAGQKRRVWVTLDLPANFEGGTEPGRFDLAWYDVDGARKVATIPVPAIAMTEDVAVAQASVDADNWERAVLNEEFNVMQTALSQQVQAGDCDGALEVISDYRVRNAALNDSVGSTAVADNIAGLEQLEAEVRQQFEGANQKAKQNFWAKTRNETAYNGRRNAK